MTSLLSPSASPNKPASLLATSLSHTFDPYTSHTLPPRILALGAAAGFASVVSITADVFGARVLVPRSVVVRGAPVTPIMTPTRTPIGFPGTSTGGFGGGYVGGGGSGTSTPGLAVPGQQAQQQAPETRAALGAAYLARWAVSVSGDFEDELRNVFKRRWKISGGLGLGGMGSGAGGGMFPITIPGGVGGYGRSGLGSSVLVEEEEEEEEDGMGANGEHDDPGRERTVTGSTAATSMSLHLQIPNPSLSLSAVASGGNGQQGSTSASVHALPTDDSDALLGLAKVAEADMDAFSAYAALVPEWCRLEGMLVKGVV